jgi:hypothetical protein
LISPGDEEDPPARWFVLTQGRTGAEHAFGMSDLIEAIGVPPAPEEQSEGARILRLCQTPRGVVEVSSHLRMPLRVVRVLLFELLDSGRIRVIAAESDPAAPIAPHVPPPLYLLEKLRRALRESFDDKERKGA